ncbi:MAG: hypothetical protein H7329_04895 [Opitutaceae bacterium]|nr:hypothetical protein [Cytophagales bacterium]
MNHLVCFLVFFQFLFISFSSAAQDTTIIFPDGISIVLRKEFKNGKETYHLDKNQLKVINRQLKYLTNALKVHESTSSIYKDNEIALDSINTLYAQKASVEELNTESYKKAYEDLKEINNKYKVQLELCSMDLKRGAADLKQSGKKRKLIILKGAIAGVALGTILGIIISK